MSAAARLSCGEFRQAKVEHFGLAAFGDEDVGRLQVPVNDACRVRRVQRVRDFDGVAEDLVDRERAFAQAAGERFAFQIFHHEETGAVLVPNVVEDADVRMIQRRNRARLAVKALAPVGIARQIRRQHFDRDGAFEPRVPRSIHFAHAPGSDRGKDFVGADACAGLQGQSTFADGWTPFAK